MRTLTGSATRRGRSRRVGLEASHVLGMLLSGGPNHGHLFESSPQSGRDGYAPRRPSGVTWVMDVRRDVPFWVDHLVKRDVLKVTARRGRTSDVFSIERTLNGRSLRSPIDANLEQTFRHLTSFANVEIAGPARDSVAAQSAGDTVWSSARRGSTWRTGAAPQAALVLPGLALGVATALATTRLEQPALRHQHDRSADLHAGSGAVHCRCGAGKPRARAASALGRRGRHASRRMSCPAERQGVRHTAECESWQHFADWPPRLNGSRWTA